MSLSKHSPFFRLNRKMMCAVLKYLSMEDLSRLSSTSRRLNNAVQYYVKELQVFVDWTGEDHPMHSDPQFRNVTLKYCSPKEFFYPDPPFQYIKSLYLCFDDEQNEKINLTKLMHLKYLKIRGGLIVLSSNRLPSVTQIDIDDPNNCEKQVFCNLKNFHLEADVDEFSNLHNMTESEGLKYLFKKSLDILLDKDDIEQVSFTITITNMELLIFEMFIDSLSDFLTGFSDEIDKGHVNVLFRYSPNYEQTTRELRRWDKAWFHLKENMEIDFNNFTLTCEEYVGEYCPVL